MAKKQGNLNCCSCLQEEKIDEFLFGYYPIMEITEEISIIEKNHRFFN